MLRSRCRASLASGCCGGKRSADRTVSRGFTSSRKPLISAIAASNSPACSAARTVFAACLRHGFPRLINVRAGRHPAGEVEAHPLRLARDTNGQSSRITCLLDLALGAPKLLLAALEHSAARPGSASHGDGDVEDRHRVADTPEHLWPRSTAARFTHVRLGQAERAPGRELIERSRASPHCTDEQTASRRATACARSTATHGSASSPCTRPLRSDAGDRDRIVFRAQHVPCPQSGAAALIADARFPARGSPRGPPARQRHPVAQLQLRRPPVVRKQPR
jgi:hypothetical protein